MEEALARTFQFSLAITGAFLVALWFALVIWTYRDVAARSRNPVMQIVSLLIVVLFFIPGIVIYLLLRPAETLDERQQRMVEEEYLAQEIETVAGCPSCGHLVRDVWVFCPTCRYQLRKPCHSCGKLTEVGWEVCAFCGVELRGQTQRQEGVVNPGVAPEGSWGEPSMPDSAVREAQAAIGKRHQGSGDSSTIGPAVRDTGTDD